MKHICIPNSFDLTWGYAGINYQADSCVAPLDTQDFENIITDCDTAPHTNSRFKSSGGRIAQFWTQDLDLVDITTDTDDDTGSGDDDGDGLIVSTVPIVGSDFMLKWRYKCVEEGDCEAEDYNGYAIDFDTGEPDIKQTRITIDTYDPLSTYYTDPDNYDYSFGFYGNTFHTAGGSTGIYFIDSQSTYSPENLVFNFALYYYDDDGNISFDGASVTGKIHTLSESENLLSRATLNKDGSYRSGYSASDIDGYYTIVYNNVETQLDDGGTLTIYRNPPSENIQTSTTYIGEFDSNGTITNGFYTKWDGATGEFNAQLNKCNGDAYECQKDGYPVIPQSFDLRFELETDGDSSPLDGGFYDCGVGFDYTKSEITLNSDGTFSTGTSELRSSNVSAVSSTPYASGGRVRRENTNLKNRLRPAVKTQNLESPGRNDRDERGLGTYEFDLENGTMTLYYAGNYVENEIERTVAQSVVETYPFRYGLLRGNYSKWSGEKGTFHTNPLVFERTQVGHYDRMGGSNNDDGDYYITVNRYGEDDWYGKMGSMCLHRNPRGNQNSVLCQQILGNYTGVNYGPTAFDKGIAYKYPSGNVSEHFTWYHNYAFNLDSYGATQQCDCDSTVPNFLDYPLGLNLNCLDIEWITQFDLPYINNDSVVQNDPPGVISNIHPSCCIDNHYVYSDTPHGCTDPNASNFDCWATSDNGSCNILGCTNIDADNYNPDATEDDGSCVFISNYENRIFISEFGQDFHSYGDQQFGDLNFQYVELYNSLSYDVDISNWTLMGQRWFADSTNDDSEDGFYYYEDCPELFLGYEGEMGECCFKQSEQPMYTFPQGTVLRANNFILLVTNEKSWKPVCTDEQLFNSTTPGICWNGSFCWPDLYRVYGDAGIYVEEDYNNDGENDFVAGEWINSLGNIVSGWGRMNGQTSFDQYSQTQIGYPTYYNGSQAAMDMGSLTTGATDCMGQENPEYVTLQDTWNNCIMDYNLNGDNSTEEYWLGIKACDNEYYAAVGTTVPYLLNYNGIRCPYNYYTQGIYQDYVIPNGPLQGTVLPNAELVVLPACDNHPECLGYIEGGTGAGGCVEGPPGGYNIIDEYCHPQHTIANNTCCPDGAYYDDDFWTTGDLYGNPPNQHGYRLQRCASNLGEPVQEKYTIYNGENVSVANLFQWDRPVEGSRYPGLSGNCPEKLSLLDNGDNVVVEMGNEKIRICDDDLNCDDTGFGTHVNSHGPAGTELQIPLCLSTNTCSGGLTWDTFNSNDINQWTQSYPNGYGIGTIFSFSNGFGGDVDIIEGCTDPIADNYNPDANVDDGSCNYGDSEYSDLHFYFCDENFIRYNSCFNCDGTLETGGECIWEPDSQIVNSNCDEVQFNTQEAMWWLNNYYMLYYNRQISWKSAWENPDYNEYVPYFQGNRECGPRIVQLPASSFPSMCSTWPECRQDNSCGLCDEVYDSVFNYGFNGFASVLLNLGGTCGVCSPDETCKVEVNQSYCVSNSRVRENAPITHKDRRKYTTDFKELEILIRNPNREVVIDESIGTHQEDIE